jgi:hypothetical protein
VSNGTQLAPTPVELFQVSAQTLALAALLASSIGTGGVAAEPIIQVLCRPATGITALSCSAALNEIHALSTEGISERLTFVQSYFNLPVSQLARVLKVQRPTIYSWLRDAPTALREANFNRLELVYHLALSLHRAVKTTVSDVSAVRLSTGETLLNVLLADEINPEAVLAMLKRDGGSSVVASESLLARLRREKGFSETPQDVQQVNLEGFLGA